MSEGKLKIEIYKSKNAEDFTKVLAESDSKLEAGSAAAYSAAMSCALMVRAAAIIAAETDKNDRIDYILRNGETIRAYMVHLIDEDVKCRGPLNKALKEGGEREIEACRQPASCIAAEIINMMSQSLELTQELAQMAQLKAIQYIGESAELAMSAVRCSRLYILDMASKCSDETYRFVTRRENDITLEQCLGSYNKIMEKVNAAF